MKFWNEHAALRVCLIAGFFVLGLAGIFAGLGLKGQLLGVGIMIGGLALLLAALWLYNKPYTEEKSKQNKG